VRLSRLIVAALGALLVALPCAAARTDVVVLRSGDRFTCEIKSLQYGYLEVDTDSIGTLSIVWLDVAEVTSVHRFMVETGSGTRYVGSLQSPAAGRLKVGGAAAGELDLPSIVAIRPVRASVLARIDGSLEVQFNLARANRQKQWSLAGNAQYSGVHWFHLGSLSSRFTSQQGAADTSRNYFNVQSGRALAAGWYYAGLLELQQDQELGLNLRVGGGAGLGRYVIESNRRSLLVLGGLLVTNERFESVAGRTNLEAYVLTRYGAFRRRSPKLDAAITFGLLPNLTDAGRVRGELQLSVSVELFKNLFAGVSGFDSFDSRPPASTLTRNDYGVTPSLRWKF
jgi:uncharacterized protein DUF481